MSDKINSEQQQVDRKKYNLGHMLAFGPRPKFGENFDFDSYRFHHRILVGKYAHYCLEWDELPIDETCKEIEVCNCYPDEEITYVPPV
jgi:hypothetical protein